MYLIALASCFKGYLIGLLAWYTTWFIIFHTLYNVPPSTIVFHIIIFFVLLLGYAYTIGHKEYIAAKPRLQLNR